MGKIALKPHNIRAYNELCRTLETKDRAAYISATGTGKSYVIGKYIEDHGLISDTAILVPSTPIKRAWKALLPSVRVYTYQGASRHESEICDQSLIICDEMHHLGAKEWGEVCRSIFSRFTGKVIGTTATPIRFLDEQRNMTDEFFEGTQVTGLDLPDAISQGVLPSFEYITALFDLPERMKKRYDGNPYTETLYRQLDIMSSEYSFREILKKHLGTETDIKVAVFVSSIPEIEKIRGLCEGVFPDAHHLVAHSSTKRKETEQALRSFESGSGMSFLYTVNILNEGVHIDGVDSVIMFRKTESPTVYLQQIGRALSSSNAGRRIKIFDFVANHCNLDTYENSDGSVIGWIRNGISEPEKQIVVSDYALEELELLDKLASIIGKPWTAQEDELIRTKYNTKGGATEIHKLLPWRTRRAIMARANDLGCSRKEVVYDEFLEENIRKWYPEEGGTEKLLEMYPGCTVDTLRTFASRLGVHKKNIVPKWTEKEDSVLRANPNATKSDWASLLPGRTYRAIIRRRAELSISQSHLCDWPKNTDDILLENRSLSSSELQKRFFPEITVSAIATRRTKIGATREKEVKWTPEKMTHFLELYEAGGSSNVRTEEEFASLRTITICNLAIKFRKKLGTSNSTENQTPRMDV